MNRRNFLRAGMAGPIVLSQPKRAAGANTPVRVAANGLSANAPEIKKYATAVGLLKNLPASDPRNWNNLATVHADYCPHSNWWFLPWHRAYIYYFELTCQDVLKDAAFRLPYWDWSDYPRIPGPFLDRASVLWNDTRDQDGNVEFGAEVVGRLTVIKKVMGSSNWIDVFSGATGAEDQKEVAASGRLEGTPHNGVHSIIGGDMGSWMSPLDPVFWLHHCNVDRIWTSWAQIPGHTAPPDKLWRDHKLKQFYDPKTKQQVTPVVSNVTNAAAFGALYDRYEPAADTGRLLTKALRDSLSSTMTGAAPSMAFRRFSLETAEKLPFEGAAEYVAAANPQFQSAMKGALESAANSIWNTDISLAIEGVQAPAGRSIGFRVFLNCKTPTLDTPLDDPTYVGTLAFFGNHEGGHGSGVSFFLDVSQTLSKTVRAGVYTPQSPVDVSLVPVDLKNPRRAPEGPVIRPQKVRLVGLNPA